MKFRRTLAALLVFALAIGLTACADAPADSTAASATGSTAPQSTPPTTQSNKETVTYTIHVKTAGGMPLSGLDVLMYAGDMLHGTQTDESGMAQLTVARVNNPTVYISGVPAGYAVEDSYALTGTDTEIVLTSAPIQDGNLSDVQLGLGDVMYDFTVTTAKGEQITLSELLQEKDMVLLNFWYTTCTWCLKEFPYMETSYQAHMEDVAIVALNPFESNDVVSAFQDSYGLSFYMANCPASWANAFSVSGYPTSIVVDRYGVICLIESGGLTSTTPFENMFNHFTADNYKQQLCPGGIADITVSSKPTYEMPSSEELAAVLNQGDISITYAGATGNDAEYNWPFIIGELDGQPVVHPSNQGVDSSYSIMHATVHLQAGQAVGFEYLTSCAGGSDILYVIVENDDIYQISGVAEDGQWQKCYPWVAEKEGDYEISLCFLKDDGESDGDDTVYIRNFHVIDSSAITTPSYIPRQAALTEDHFDFTYVQVVFNEADGYYHVGSENGPLLLANLTVASLFNEELTVFDMLVNGQIVVDGHDYYDDVLPYCSYASNSSLYGVCTVNAELAEYLKIVADVAGFDSDENEWLKICFYYDVYGTNGEQLIDPIAGLAPFSAYIATEGKNVETNYIYYDRTIIPRGLFARFVPERSGVYRITSRTETGSSIEGWIFNADMEEILVYEMDERIYADENNVSMVLYMEAGVEYYIDICYWDLYETGYIYYDIEYVAAEYDHFRLGSPGYFTYDSDASGDNMYYPIAGGVKPILIDGKYYVDLGDGKVGSLLYADFTGCALFNVSIASMIEMGGFNFAITENDETILYYMSLNDNDPDKTRQYLKELWGEDYDGYAENFQVEDVLAGKYHGDGEDYTELMRSYLEKMETGPIERQGCVVVDEQLAEILQILMDKYTFAGVDHSWTKLCYYYDHMGPAE